MSANNVVLAVISNDVWPQIIVSYCIMHRDIRFLSSVCKLFAKIVDETYHTILRSNFSGGCVSPIKIFYRLLSILRDSLNGISVEEELICSHNIIPLSIETSTALHHSFGYGTERKYLRIELYELCIRYTTNGGLYVLSGLCKSTRLPAMMKMRAFLERYLHEVARHLIWDEKYSLQDN